MSANDIVDTSVEKLTTLDGGTSVGGRRRRGDFGDGVGGSNRSSRSKSSEAVLVEPGWGEGSGTTSESLTVGLGSLAVCMSNER